MYQTSAPVHQSNVTVSHDVPRKTSRLVTRSNAARFTRRAELEPMNRELRSRPMSRTSAAEY